MFYNDNPAWIQFPTESRTAHQRVHCVSNTNTSRKTVSSIYGRPLKKCNLNYFNIFIQCHMYICMWMYIQYISVFKDFCLNNFMELKIQMRSYCEEFAQNIRVLSVHFFRNTEYSSWMDSVVKGHGWSHFDIFLSPWRQTQISKPFSLVKHRKDAACQCYTLVSMKQYVHGVNNVPIKWTMTWNLHSLSSVLSAL